MGTFFRIFIAALIIAAISITTSIYFHWKFMELMAMIAVLTIVLAIALAVYAAQEKGGRMSVAWVFLGFGVVACATFSGWQSNFAPADFQFKACTEFYQIVQLQPQGCSTEEIKIALHQGFPRVVAGVSFDKKLAKALDTDLQEAWRAERENRFITPPFPRFRQAWGEYQAALANSATDRLVGPPGQIGKMSVVIFSLIYIGFLINGVAAFLNLKVVGGGLAVVGLLTAFLSWIGWVTPGWFFGAASAATTKVLEGYWNWGFWLGVIPQILPAFSTIADVFKDNLRSKVLVVGIPAFFLTLGVVLEPTLLLPLISSDINQNILSYPDLAISAVQYAIIFGLLTAFGGVAFFNGLIKLFKPGEE